MKVSAFGPIARLGPDWAIEIGKGVRHKVVAGELIHLRQKGASLPPLPSGEHLLLATGDRLPFRVALHHQRLKAVTVPFAMWIENGQGQVVFKQRSQPYAMHFGDVVEFSGELALPASIPPGNYSLKVGTTKMQQGVAWESQSFQIVPWGVKYRMRRLGGAACASSSGTNGAAAAVAPR